MKKSFLTTLAIMLFSAMFFCGVIFCTDAPEAEAATITYYLGGQPIGIQAKSKYFVITDFIGVITKEGSYSPAQKSGLQKGDIILSVNGQNPLDLQSLIALIDSQEQLEFVVQRGKEIMRFDVQTAYDISHQQRKVGIMVKNDLSGIGTVTFYTDTGAFGALGHPIADEFGHSSIYSHGNVTECEILGYNRPQKNTPGELRGRIIADKTIGTFDTNTISGINGRLSALPNVKQATLLGNKDDVVTGKAQIYTTIEGNEPQTYDIEIVKANHQATEKEKSMLIRVTDKRLLETTGGILQGMSGSPIVQNGKLIGAVTHVMTADPSLGYGIYIEWMIN